MIVTDDRGGCDGNSDKIIVGGVPANAEVGGLVGVDNESFRPDANVCAPSMYVN